MTPLKVILREVPVEDPNAGQTEGAAAVPEPSPDREYYLYEDRAFEFLDIKAPRSGKFELLVFTKNSK
jgi:hypothetical protein